MASTQTQLIQAFVRHQTYLERYSKGEAKRFQKFVDQAYKSYRKILANGSYNNPIELNLIINQIEEINKTLRQNARDFIGQQTSDLGPVEAEMAQKAISSSTDVKIAFTGVTVEQITAAVNSNPLEFEKKSLKATIGKFTRSQNRLIKRKIREGFAAGIPTDDIANDLVSERALTTRRAEALVRTSINHIATSAHREFYKQNDDIVEFERYTAVLDGNTTVTCASRDSKQFKIGTGPSIPAHWRCRSQYVPVLYAKYLNKDAAVGSRASKQPISRGTTKDDTRGQAIRADTNYEKYIRGQPLWYTEKVLGKGKAALLLKGDLPLDSFVDSIRKGNELTLKQLIKLHPGAAEKAGLLD